MWIFSPLFRNNDNKFSLLFALSCINCRTHLFTDSFDTLVRFRDSEGGRWEIIEEVYECRLNADKTRLQRDPPGNPAEPVNTATHSDSGLWIRARRGKPASVWLTRQHVKHEYVPRVSPQPTTLEHTRTHTHGPPRIDLFN